jgi:predicted nucleotidyltransferase
MDKKMVIHQIRQVLKRHHYVVKAELFGSLARGDETPDSDVDLLVVYDETRPKGFSAFSIFGELEESIGRKVDIVQEHLLHDFVKKNIQDSREVIYERR